MKQGIMIIVVLSFTVCSAGVPHSQDLQTAFRQWAQALTIDPRVTTELGWFQVNHEPLSPEYRDTLPRRVRARIVSEVEQRLQAFLDGHCTPFVKVSFMSPGFAMPGRDRTLQHVEKQFEKGFLRVEAVACFSETPHRAEEVLRMYTSAEFLLTTSSTFKQIWKDQERSCVETNGVPALMKPMHYCNRLTELYREGLAVEHSQVIANKAQSSYQSMYFKESLKTFVELPDGLAFHYLNYTRSASLGALKKFLGKKGVARSQKSAIDKLRERLNVETQG